MTRVRARAGSTLVLRLAAHLRSALTGTRPQAGPQNGGACVYPLNHRSNSGRSRGITDVRDPMTPNEHNLWQQLFWLLILAIPIACVARTVVFEEVFREPREYCERKSKQSDSLPKRKFFYLFTCEYCFSHYVTVFFLIVTRYQLLLPGWRGYLIAFFALVFVANAYLNLYSRLRIEITSEKKAIEVKEKEIEATDVRIQKLESEMADSPGNGR